MSTYIKNIDFTVKSIGCYNIGRNNEDKETRVVSKATKNDIDTSTLTKDQLWELEQNNHSKGQKILDIIISILPVVGCAIALLEYYLIPNKYNNNNPERYAILLIIPVVIYFLLWICAMLNYVKGNKQKFARLRHSAPFMTAIYICLALLDFLTLKTGKLMYPFIPWVNDIINVAISDHKQLIKCTLFTLRLLFGGYISGVVIGLVTGVACGYSKKVNYWVNPIVKILGPIPTATWIPLIMLLASSLMAGSIFIVGLGTWFAVTVATTTGISNVDKSYFEVARTLGATERQLVFRIAIPHAMPSILQGMTQGMSSACVSLMIAEMMGVEAGLGWYITWAKAWAAYNKMFAAIVIICITFNVVTRVLDVIKKYLLRWQIGVTK